MELARKGAEVRLRELQAEIAQLRKVFLHLPFGSAVSPAIPARARELEGPNTRRRMSAKERAAVSKRMKAYWAARRKAKKSGKSAAKA
jgi:hypothetical protein